ncbi:MFS transporter [Streptomyces sp. XD-27]|uniref:MFS transporter n=1 Tax=Streptomyces sp. XD-27 TaxID=3062779 RepID=UPI0026F41FFC|nr:MFS transporter [Streptomyces sp. XD-27]WKX72665.1 MFS transporter [Streptomyces sp. XD-27]
MPTPSGPVNPGPTDARPPAEQSSDPGEGTGGHPGEGTGYRAVFAVKEFRAVFAAHLMSMLGEVVCAIALSVLIYRLTGSPLMSALAFALALLPYMIGGTLLSAVADRYPARRVLVVCDLLSALCTAAMVVPGMPVAALLALRCVAAAISPVFSGTRAATLGDILGEGDLFVLGRSVIRITAQSAQLAGFAVGGLLLTAVAPRAVLVITAVAFLGSALVLRLGTRRRPAREGAGSGGALLGESLRVIRWLFAHRRIRALLLLSWVPPMFVVAPEALATPYADDLGLGPAGLGLLMIAMPVGAIASEVVVGSRLSPRARAALTLPVAVLAMLPALGYLFRPSLPWALLCLLLAGCGSSYTLGLDQWFIAAVPEEVRGRAMTVLTAGLMTTQGLGMALAGAAAEFAPVHQVVAGAGVLGTACVVLVAAEARRTAR